MTGWVGLDGEGDGGDGLRDDAFAAACEAEPFGGGGFEADAVGG